MIDARDLAKLIIETLDQQKKYFASRRTEDLQRSKALEKELRSRANKVLSYGSINEVPFDQAKFPLEES